MLTAPMNEPPRPEPIIILASGSPRRRELLQAAGYDVRVIPPVEDVECGVCSESGPAGLVAELAHRKATAVWQQISNNPAPSFERTRTVIVAADTVAECDGFILGKPRDEDDARAMLTSLSGREHRVYTGLIVWPLGQLPAFPARNVSPVQVAVTTLRMDALSTSRLDEYIESGQWEGKAGDFGYQDRLGWVHIVEGSESNVVGLPMELLANRLSKLGFKVPGDEGQE